ncbi:MAG: hypothetical protein AB2728_13935 [Candidatus Thiodiazotropha sp.]|nr:hypothetical protein [Candidatus Thiodiazotropha taylori]MBT3059056.1 hypothetical protein [Candidatus Thiodiazotropha sp. (ex Lucina pensylvanica)]MBT3062397.1 hypothetical protein [Candidatus Thiodiazotropha sp. (ex Lucina pensylvanica)]MBV2094775.1 hypothetical protein [Candidatus Thiodiazotropha sp. (ex Codakia orbicularis)]
MVRAEWMPGCGPCPANQRTVSVLGCLCLIQLYLCMPVLAEQGEEAVPSAAFFEFLADWEDEKGDWQDPMEYQEMGLDFLDQKEDQVDE